MTKDQDFDEDLQSLDAIPERETFQVGVLYVNRDQSGSEQILGNLGGSDGFRHLVQNLGWLVNLQEHRGFKGNLTTEAGPQAPYYASYDVEAIFGVSVFFGGSSAENKLKFLGESRVLVTWVEDIEHFTPDEKIPAKINIVLSPLDSKLVHVRILGDEGMSLTGPLVNNMSVTPSRLPVLVRETAINACRMLHSGDETLMQRKEALNHFIVRHRSEENPTEFYSSLIAHSS